MGKPPSLMTFLVEKANYNSALGLHWLSYHESSCFPLLKRLYVLRIWIKRLLKQKGNIFCYYTGVITSWLDPKNMAFSNRGLHFRLGID